MAKGASNALPPPQPENTLEGTCLRQNRKRVRTGRNGGGPVTAARTRAFAQAPVLFPLDSGAETA